jgi:peptidoglycan lytic transglycosylase
MTSGIASAQFPGAPSAQSAQSGDKVRPKIRVRAARHAMAGRKVRVRGHVGTGGVRRRVHVRLVGGGRARAVLTRPSGRFWTALRAPRTGRFRVRASTEATSLARAARATMRGRVNVYRRASASWYGPGLYGNPLACGGTFGPGTLGVAHKTLPCGSRVTLRHSGHTVTVRVVDRGPFVAGREFDLTSATKQRLRFPMLGSVLTTK